MFTNADCGRAGGSFYLKNNSNGLFEDPWYRIQKLASEMLVLARSFFIPKSLLEIVVGQNKATIFYYYYSTKTMYTKAQKARQFFQCLKEFPFIVF